MINSGYADLYKNNVKSEKHQKSKKNEIQHSTVRKIIDYTHWQAWRLKVDDLVCCTSAWSSRPAAPEVLTNQFFQTKSQIVVTHTNEV